MTHFIVYKKKHTLRFIIIITKLHEIRNRKTNVKFIILIRHMLRKTKAENCINNEKNLQNIRSEFHK